MTRLWTPSNSSSSMFLREYGDHTTKQYSRLDLTKEHQRVLRVFKSFRPLQVLLINPRILFILAVTQFTWDFHLKWWSVIIPRCLNSSTSSNWESFNKKVEVDGCFFQLIFIILHFLTLNSIRFCVLHFSSFSRSCWSNLRSSLDSMILGV